jgi:resuscitation-promoting factor RpfA
MRPLGAMTLVALDVGVLVAMRPDGTLVHHLLAPHAWLHAVGVDSAAVQLTSAALWLAAVWLAVGLAAIGASALPGGAGRLARHLARAVLPHAIYRVAAGAAGIGVVLSPALAVAAGPGATATSAATAPAGAIIPTPSWPTDDTLPAPTWPTTTGTTASSPPSTPTAASHPASTVVVRRGDSLWRIAASRLPGHPSERRIAASWPRWYAANRTVVGNDPDHIVPGQLLHVPGQLLHAPAKEGP